MEAEACKPETPEEKTPCGLDLGSNNTLIAVIEKGNTVPTFIKTEGQLNCHGTYVYFPESSKDQPIFGVNALAMIGSPSGKNVVCHIKRGLGVTTDKIKDLSIFNATVANPGQQRYPIFNLHIDGQVVQKTAKEIMTLFLVHYRQKIERTVQGQVGVVASKPQYWGSSQNTAFKECLNEAGFGVLKVLTEPTAAMFSYRAKTGDVGKEMTLVADKGAGTIDFVLQEDLGAGKYKTYCVGGDDQLGSVDVDKAFLNELKTQLKKEPGYNEDVFTQMSPDNLQKMQNMKHMLSSLPQVSQIIAGITSTPFTFVINQAKKEKILKQIYERVEEVLDEMIQRLADSSKGKHKADGIKRSIKKVAMVGGGMLDRYYGEKLFPKMFPNAVIVGREVSQDSVDPITAVSTGCAFWAATILKTANVKAGLPANPINQLVLSKTLGIETVSNPGRRDEKRIFSPIVKSQTSIPTVKMCDKFSTSVDDQAVAWIEIYQGEGGLTTDDGVIFLGKYAVDMELPNKAFMPVIEVEMEISDENILTVRAGERGKPKKELTITETV